MFVLPAIDLMSGKCVRLIQGQYHRQITYKDDPVEQAQEFASAGADHLHIVDLDGAKMGHPVNTEAIRAIADSVDMNIEVGGGIRDEAAIQELLDIGVDNIIIGTRAVTDFDWFSEMTRKFKGHLILGLDARGSKVSTEGWTHDSQEKIWDYAVKTKNLPIAAIIYTDISKDGMMSGPNFERTGELAQKVEVPVICAGGVTEVSDIIRLKELGIAGAIIGRSLYEGRIDLREAIAAGK